MRNRYLLATLASAIIGIAIIWMPFVLKVRQLGGINFEGAGIERVVQNFDGLNFLVVAKTWYNPELIEQQYQEILNGRRPLYFAAHYPLYPAIISIFDLFLSGPHAILAAIVITNLLLAWALFNFFELLFDNPKKAFLLASVVLYFPARMLAVRTVGSNEPLFMALVLMSLTASIKGKHGQAGMMGALSVLARSPGILLFPAYLIYYGWTYRKDLAQAWKVILPYCLIPLALIALFGFYGWRLNNLLAYFQVGGNINLYYPFAVFGSSLPWVGGFWLEDIVYLLVVATISLYMAYRNRKETKAKNTPHLVFALVYLIFLCLVAHRDLARYGLPLVPVIALGWHKLLDDQKIKYLMLLMLIPIVLYSWQFVAANYQPISNWLPYL